MLKRIIFLFVLTAIFACKPKQELILIETDYGNMKISLYESTPKHSENFKKLVNEGFYDGLLFHRVIDGFMIQGGDPKSKDAVAGQRLGTGGPGYLVDAEIGAPHFKGTVAAARTGGPSNPDKKSSGSQFYIVQGTPVDDNMLNAMEQRKGITYSAEDRQRYKEVGGTPQLDGDYTVFGEVVDGLDVIEKIAKVQKDPSDRPIKDVKMTMRIVK